MAAYLFSLLPIPLLPSEKKESGKKKKKKKKGKITETLNKDPGLRRCQLATLSSS